VVDSVREKTYDQGREMDRGGGDFTKKVNVRKHHRNYWIPTNLGRVKGGGGSVFSKSPNIGEDKGGERKNNIVHL